MPLASVPAPGETTADQPVSGINAIDPYQRKGAAIAINVLAHDDNAPFGKKGTEFVTGCIALLEIAPGVARAIVLALGRIRELRGVDVGDADAFGSAPDRVAIVDRHRWAQRAGGPNRKEGKQGHRPLLSFPLPQGQPATQDWSAPDTPVSSPSTTSGGIVMSAASK